MNSWVLIGKDVNYSFSPLIHNYLFTKYNQQGEYSIHNTNSFSKQTLSQFKGGNITIPYKYNGFLLAGKSNFESKSINTFKRGSKGLEFYSTDQFGIIDSIEKLQITYFQTRIHVIRGDGATGQMIASCLINHFNIDSKKVYIISRKQYKPHASPSIIDDTYFETKIKANYVLYNGTPLGSGKLKNKSPFTSEQVKNAIGIFDTCYNPQYNALGKSAYKLRTRYINGLNMLIIQAMHSFEFWTGINVDCEYSNIKRTILFNASPKLILCAMPFAGKTTLYKRKKKVSIDLDLEIERYTSIPNAEFITKYGIDKFRIVETKVLKASLLRSDIKLIFLGGGTLTAASSIELLENHLVVYMQVRLETLKRRFDLSRGNIQSIEKLESLYFERDRHYRNISSMQIGSKGIERIIDEYMGD